jgi:hypothetical protein
MAIRVDVEQPSRATDGELPCIASHSKWGIGILFRDFGKYSFLILQPNPGHLKCHLIKDITNLSMFEFMNERVTIQNVG